MGRRYRQLESGAIDGRKKMQKKIQIFIRQYHMIEENDHVAVGYPGRRLRLLLHLLCELRKCMHSPDSGACGARHPRRGKSCRRGICQAALRRLERAAAHIFGGCAPPGKNAASVAGGSGAGAALSSVFMRLAENAVQTVWQWHTM